MGRLSDARKKARKKQTGGKQGGESENATSKEQPSTLVEAHEPKTAASDSPAAPAQGATEPVSQEQAVVRTEAPVSEVPVSEDDLAVADYPAPESETTAADEVEPAEQLAEQPPEPTAPESEADLPVQEQAARKRTETKSSTVQLPASGLADDILLELARQEAVATTAEQTDTEPAGDEAGDDFEPFDDDAWDAYLKESQGTPSSFDLRALPSSGLADDILRLAEGPDENETDGDELHGGFEDFFEEDEANEQLHLVHFAIGPEIYAVDIGKVQEIIRVPAVTRVPNAAAHVRGVFNLRGRIVAVYDLRRLLKLPAHDVAKESRVMVLDLQGKILGVLIDRVIEVARVDIPDIEPPPEEVSSIDANLVTGVARYRDQMVFLLDVDRVLGFR